MRAPGGGASYLGVGRAGSGTLPPPTSILWGVRPGPTTHWLWVRGVWAWGRVTLPGCGVSGFGRSPTPDHSSFRAFGRGPLPT